MAEANHMCEIEGCSMVATAFGLEGTQKTRCCEQHTALLISKGMSAHRIDEYDFISNPQDAEALSERKKTAEKGLGNLAVLEASVQAEYAAALQLLESEKNALLRTTELLFLDIQTAVANRLASVSEQLASLSTNLRDYTKVKECVLGPGAALVCKEVKSAPELIHLVAAGISEPVSRAFKQHWSVSAGDLEAYLKIAVSALSEPATIESGERHRKKGEQFLISRQWKEAEESFLQAKALFEVCAPQSKAAADNLNDLGSLLRRTKRMSEAEECHRRAQEIFAATAPHSANTACNHHNYGLLLVELSRLDEAEHHYEQTKRIYEAAGRHMASLANLYRDLGNLRKKQSRPGEVEECYRQARRIYQAVDPQSREAGLFYLDAGIYYFKEKRYKEAEESCSLAEGIYETKDPQSANRADCWNYMALIYEAENRVEESIAAFLFAAEQYSLRGDIRKKSKAEESVLRLQATLNSRNT